MKGAVTRSPLRQRGRAGTDPGKKPVPAASRRCRAGIAHRLPFLSPYARSLFPIQGVSSRALAQA